MQKAIIHRSTLDFLTALSKNNNRDWFNQNKDRYLRELEHMVVFADALLDKMRTHDLIETESGKKSLFRIYNDTRFFKNKPPYKNHWAGGFTRATKKLRGSYYFHIQPGNSYISGGFYGPNPDDLKRIRQDIDMNYSDWRKLMNSAGIKKTFGTFIEERVATAPRGYAANHPAIDLLRQKTFYMRHYFTNEEVLSPGFLDNMNKTFRALRPFLDHMSEILTTNLNGEPLV